MMSGPNEEAIDSMIEATVVLLRKLKLKNAPTDALRGGLYADGVTKSLRKEHRQQGFKWARECP
jgi:hypothetical protein